MNRPLQRHQPKLAPASYKTYGIAAPKQTHRRKATCEEVNCGAYLRGWVTILPTSRPDLIALLKNSGRRYVETPQAGGMVEFKFEAGQACFDVAKHTVRLDRPELYLVRGGDWRAKTTPVRLHDEPEHWVEDFSEHQDSLQKAQR